MSLYILMVPEETNGHEVPAPGARPFDFIEKIQEGLRALRFEELPDDFEITPAIIMRGKQAFKEIYERAKEVPIPIESREQIELYRAFLYDESNFKNTSERILQVFLDFTYRANGVDNNLMLIGTIILLIPQLYELLIQYEQEQNEPGK